MLFFLLGIAWAGTTSYSVTPDIITLQHYIDSAFNVTEQTISVDSQRVIYVVTYPYISPSPAYPGSTLMGYCNMSDTYGRQLTYNYTWYLNNSVNKTGSVGSVPSGTEVNAGNVSSSSLAIGQVWKLQCLGYSSNDSAVYNSSTLDISQGLYLNSSRISPATAYPGSTLLGYCNATDLPGLNISYNYTWFKNNVSYLSGAASGNFISGTETNVANVTSGNLSVGQNWSFQCTAYNANGALRLNSTKISVLQAIYMNTSSILPTVAYSGGTLMGYCNASDLSGASVYYNYTWFRNGAAVLFGSSGPFAQGVASNAANVTSANLSSGQNWIFQCLGYNANGATTFLNSSVRTISQALTLQAARLSPNTTVYQSYNVSGYCNASDASGFNISYNYTWFKNNVSNITGSVSGNFTSGLEINVANITSGNLSVGQNWTLQCTAYNPNGMVSSNSSILSISRAVYMNTSSILPATAYAGSTLLGYCNASDRSGASVYYNYTWFKNGIIALSGSSGPFVQGVASNVANITSGNLSIGHNWTLQCQAYNGNGASALLNSSIRAISPALLIRTARLSPNTTAYPSHTVLGYCNATDISGLGVSYNYTWFRNGTSVLSGSAPGPFAQGIETNIVNLSEIFSPGQSWKLQCTGYNANGAGSINSSQINISQALSISSPRISPTPAYLGNSIMGYCNASDVLSLGVSYNYTWHLNGAAYASGSTGPFQSGIEINVANITSGNLVLGQNWTLQCTAYNADGSVSLNSSIKEIVQGLSMSSARISPSVPYTNSVLLGYCNASDNSGSLMSYNYTWRLNGEENASGSAPGPFAQGVEINVGNLSLPFSKDQNWSLDCTVYNSNGVKSLSSSNSTILERPIVSVFGGATTNFTNISNVAHVTNLTLEVVGSGKISFPPEYTINSNGENYDTNVAIGTGFVSVNTSNLDASFNSTATITMNLRGYYSRSIPPVIYYSSDYASTSYDILQNGVECTAPRCSDIHWDTTNKILNFTVQGFSGYAVPGGIYGYDAELGINITSTNQIAIYTSNGLNDTVFDFKPVTPPAGGSVTLMSNETSNTTTGETGFLIQNQGNVNVSINVSSDKNASEFIGGTSPLFQLFGVENETGSCAGTGINSSAQDLGVGISLCPSLQFTDSSDTVWGYVLIKIDSDSPPRSNKAVLTFTSTEVQ